MVVHAQPAMSERNGCCLLQGKAQIDEGRLGEEQPGGRPGRGPENKRPVVAGFSWHAAGHPIPTKIPAAAGFPADVVAGWASQPLSKSCSVLSDGLVCSAPL